LQKKTEQIHNASMQILERVGIKIHHREILDLLIKNNIKVTGETVFFSRDQVMARVAEAPQKFTLHARNSEYDMNIGGDNTEYGAGYGCPAIIGPDGKRRNARFDDYLNFLKLVHQCEHFKLNGGILVQPEELRPDHVHAVMTYAALRYSDKALLGMSGRAKDVQKIMDLAGIVFGGMEQLIKKPRVLTLVNTLSPLQIDAAALDTIKVCTCYRQPVIISPGPMAGATGPVTLAGNIALGNAEALAGIAICQMLQPGTPVVYGLQAASSDLKTAGITIGTPDFVLEASWCARMAKYYQLPCRGGGCSSDAQILSVQSGYESMLQMFAACQEKINLILHAAGILDGYGAMSYEKFFVDLEIIGMIRHYLKGVRVDEDSLALDTIAQVGPGGEYLTCRHTLENCRKIPWQPEISARNLQHGSDFNAQILMNIQTKKKKMLSGYHHPDLDFDIKTRLDKYLADLGIGLGFMK